MAEELLLPESANSGGPSPDVLGLALQQKKWLILGLVAGLVLGYLAYLKMGPSYLATARVLVSKRSQVPIKQETGHTTFGERGEHVALIMSPLIVEDAVNIGKLDQLASLKKSKDVVEDILAGLKVKRTAGSDTSAVNVLEISYESRVRTEAQVVVSAIVEAYEAYLKRTQEEYTTEAVSLISRADSELHKNLKQKEQEYLKFREEAPLQWKSAPGADGVPGESTNVHQERVTAIETERNINMLRRSEMNSRLKAIEQAKQRGDSPAAMEMLVNKFMAAGGQAGSGVIPGSAKADALVRMEVTLLPLLLQEKKLLRDFGPDHPDVKAVRNSIRTTREFYEAQAKGVMAEGGKILNGPKVDLATVYATALRQELAEVEFREKELAEDFEKESKAAKAFARYQLEDEARSDEIRRIKTLWELVIGRLQEINIVKDNTGYSMKVIADPREELSLKRKLKIVGGGATIGLALACVVIYLRALLDTRLKSVEDVQQAFQSTVLGRVPEVDMAEISVKKPSLLDPSLYYYHHPGSPQSEAFRSLRSALFVYTFSSGDKVIQVTSPEPSDGKTTLISNLALAIAQTGKKVLLIDADMRCPRVHKLFGLQQQLGLSDVLSGEVELPNALLTTEVQNLSILGSGVSRASPAEMLTSDRFQRVIKDVRSEFDYVLVDSPPLLAVSDPCIVAAQTDALLLVLRLGKNRRAVAKRAKEMLATHGVKLLGMVVNGVEDSSEYAEGYSRYSNAGYFNAGATENKSDTKAKSKSKSKTPVAK